MAWLWQKERKCQEQAIAERCHFSSHCCSTQKVLQVIAQWQNKDEASHLGGVFPSISVICAVHVHTALAPMFRFYNSTTSKKLSLTQKYFSNTHIAAKLRTVPTERNQDNCLRCHPMLFHRIAKQHKTMFLWPSGVTSLHNCDDLWGWSLGHNNVWFLCTQCFFVMVPMALLSRYKHQYHFLNPPNPDALSKAVRICNHAHPDFPDNQVFDFMIQPGAPNAPPEHVQSALPFLNTSFWCFWAKNIQLREHELPAGSKPHHLFM